MECLEIAERSGQAARPVFNHPLPENGSMNNPSVYLKSLSKASGTPYSLLCRHYAMERFLHRLGLSRHSHSFYLKGGMLLMGWGSSSARPTLDIDLLGHVANTPDTIIKVFREILRTQPQVQDGVSFLTDIEVREITKEALYTGLRVQFTAQVQSEKITMKVDIGFGDDLYPEAIEFQYPALVPEMPSATVRCYSKESLIAEKWQAMVQLGSFNSRMKDFYDLWMLSREHTFHLPVLKEAIRRTFSHRNTDWNAYLNLKDETYCRLQQPEWAAFVRKMKAAAFQRKLNMELPSIQFADVLEIILDWLEPVMTTDMEARWIPGKHWEKR